MKTFRIYYTMPGATYKRTPAETVEASDAETAAKVFKARHGAACIVGIFAAEVVEA